MAVAWLLLLGLAAAGCRQYHISDGGRPGLLFEGTRVVWTEGDWARILAGSQSVRLTRRGVFTYDEATRNLESFGWVKIPCNVTSDALCRGDAGAVFPAFRVQQTGEARF